MTIFITMNFYRYSFLPVKQNINVGDNLVSSLELPGPVKQNVSLELSSVPDSHSTNINHNHKLTCNTTNSFPVTSKPGQLEMKLRLFGLVPIHRMLVNVVEPVSVIPGGQSVGVLLHAEGVLVVGEAGVEKNGRTFFPARTAGIEVGDLLLKVNGLKITSENQLQKIVDQCGRQDKDITLLVQHGKKTKKTKITPVLCDKTDLYRIGLFIKNSTAGVGTLTFYEPQTHIYGALGHVIADFDSGQKLNPLDGKIVEATVNGIHPGKKGSPGEKLGVFKGNSDIVGNIEKNTGYGIFGRLQKKSTNPYYNQPIPVAMRYQVKVGRAEILTVLHGDKMEKFNIEILDILPDGNNKELIIKVTDKDLLQSTGGIIQGMSGSPIIQNGRLVGAVTHVFINDPSKGYGVLAENMLNEANLINEMQAKKEAS